MLELAKDFFEYYFKKALRNLNGAYPFFIPEKVLRKEMNVLISKQLKERFRDIAELKLTSMINRLEDDGFIPYVEYFLVFREFSVNMSDTQWNEVKKIASDCEIYLENWNDTQVFTWEQPSIFLEYTHQYSMLFNKIFELNDYISFYGGEIYTQNENDESFFYDRFTLFDHHFLNFSTITFSKNQLEFYAKSHGKEIYREVASDALATIENLIMK